MRPQPRTSAALLCNILEETLRSLVAVGERSVVSSFIVVFVFVLLRFCVCVTARASTCRPDSFTVVPGHTTAGDSSGLSPAGFIVAFILDCCMHPMARCFGCSALHFWGPSNLESQQSVACAAPCTVLEGVQPKGWLQRCHCLIAWTDEHALCASSLTLWRRHSDWGQFLHTPVAPRYLVV